MIQDPREFVRNHLTRREDAITTHGRREGAMTSWNYVVTAHKPTNVTHSLVGNFTGPSDLNLIVSKCTRIEVHKVDQEGLHCMMDVPLYGRIATMELWRPAGHTQDMMCAPAFWFHSLHRVHKEWNSCALWPLPTPHTSSSSRELPLLSLTSSLTPGRSPSPTPTTAPWVRTPPPPTCPSITVFLFSIHTHTHTTKRLQHLSPHSKPLHHNIPHMLAS